MQGFSLSKPRFQPCEKSLVFLLLLLLFCGFFIGHDLLCCFFYWLLLPGFAVIGHQILLLCGCCQCLLCYVCYLLAQVGQLLRLLLNDAVFLCQCFGVPVLLLLLAVFQLDNFSFQKCYVVLCAGLIFWLNWLFFFGCFWLIIQP